MTNILQLLLALVLGGIVGLEREYKRKEAGVKTYSLVSLGACLFTILGIKLVENFAGSPGSAVDIGRIIQAVAIGVGFIGAGVVFRKEEHIEGLTTAAGLWVVAGMGILVGLGFYILAIFVSFLTLGVLAGLSVAEEKIFPEK